MCQPYIEAATTLSHIKNCEKFTVKGDTTGEVFFLNYLQNAYGILVCSA